MPRNDVLTTVPKLAERIGISRWALGRMLEAEGFKFTGKGHSRRVSLSRFARTFPEVWEGLMEKESNRRVA